MALNTFKIFSGMHDSLEMKKEKEILAYKEKVFDIENKKSDLKHKYDLEKSVLKIKNQTIKNVIKIGVISFVLILGLALIMSKRLKYLKRQKAIIDKQNNERKFLLMEIHHRVKNNFQIICSMLKLQSFDENNEVVEKAFEEAINRIHAMSNVHELIYQQEQFSLINSMEYFKLLVNSLKKSSGNNNIEFKLDSSIESLSLPVLINLGISVNEFVTNSLKYAFDDSIDQPIISIKLYEENNNKVLEYIDNGIGFKGERKKTSFGMELIESIIEKIDGELIQNDKDKAHFYIKF
jgi:two-component sensor histidine kinase